MRNKRLIWILITIAIILLIPFVAMQFTDEVKWKPFDFALAAALLLSTGLICELVLRVVKKPLYRIIICVLVLLVLLLVWLELAVGIFGTAMAGS